MFQSPGQTGELYRYTTGIWEKDSVIAEKGGGGWGGVFVSLLMLIRGLIRCANSGHVIGLSHLIWV